MNPFFAIIIALQDAWSDHPDLLQELDRVPADVTEGIFAARGVSTLTGLDFDDNTWTKRLVGALKRHLPNHDAKYTADDATSFRIVQSQYSLLGIADDVVECYINFRGCTDIRIGKNIVVETEDQIEDSPSSGDDSKIELRKKADPLNAYPPKLGQLIAAIHITILQKCARMFIKGKPIKDELRGSGMYLNKLIAPFLVEMKMPVVCASSSCPASLPRALVSITTSAARALSSELLCHGLGELVGTTKCTMQGSEK